MNSYGIANPTYCVSVRPGSGSVVDRIGKVKCILGSYKSTRVEFVCSSDMSKSSGQGGGKVGQFWGL